MVGFLVVEEAVGNFLPGLGGEFEREARRGVVQGEKRRGWRLENGF